LGLAGMINTMIATCDVDPVGDPGGSGVSPGRGVPAVEDVLAGEQRALARLITALECGAVPDGKLDELRRAAAGRTVPVLGITGSAKAAGFDLVIIETPGIGQGDAAIVPHVAVPIYVMTPEFGAASQLEKIDMLDFAEAVVINKFDRRGADDALRDVRRQMVRNREAFGAKPEEMPVF